MMIDDDNLVHIQHENFFAKRLNYFESEQLDGTLIEIKLFRFYSLVIFNMKCVLYINISITTLLLPHLGKVLTEFRVLLREK